MLQKSSRSKKSNNVRDYSLIYYSTYVTVRKVSNINESASPIEDTERHVRIVKIELFFEQMQRGDQVI